MDQFPRKRCEITPVMVGGNKDFRKTETVRFVQSGAKGIECVVHIFGIPEHHLIM